MCIRDREICLVLGSFGGIMALAMALSGMANEGKYLLYNDMRRYYQMQLFLRSLSCSYKDIESEEGQTKYQRAMNTLRYGDLSGTSVMLVAAVEILTSSLCFIIYSGIISALSPFMLLALVFLSLISLFSKMCIRDSFKAKSKVTRLITTRPEKS